MTVVPGNVDETGRDRLAMGYQTANVIELLRRCSDILEPHNLVMVLEPLNWYANHGGTFLQGSPQAYAICKAVDSPVKPAPMTTTSVSSVPTNSGRRCGWFAVAVHRLLEITGFSFSIIKLRFQIDFGGWPRQSVFEMTARRERHASTGESV